MAEEQDREDSTEQPTPRRLQKAREEGSVLRAHDMAAAVVLVTGAALLSLGGQWLIDGLQRALRLGLGGNAAIAQEPARLAALAMQILSAGFGGVVTLLLILAAAGFIADIAIGGWVFSARPLIPNFSRVSPASGFGRLFSRAAAMELLKALLKFLVVGTIAVWLLRSWAADFAHLAAEQWPYALGRAALLCSRVFLVLACCLVGVAALDLPYQLWLHRDRLKMTRQEVRDELRELEGSPHTKRRIRALRARIARMRMMTEVAKADVVVTNPDHYAAALSYREGRMRAPRLVAKGTGLIALRIREVAVDNNVSIVEAPPLARAICRYVEIDEEIPPGLYPPVAEVLAYVYRLRWAQANGRPTPAEPAEERLEPADPFRA